MAEVTQQDIDNLKSTVFAPNGGNAPIANLAPHEKSTVQQLDAAPLIETKQDAAPAADPAAPTTQDAPVSDAIDYNKWLRENFNYDSADVLKQELENYNKLKSAPAGNIPTFKDDTHKRWYEYFIEGKEDELTQALEARKMLKNVDTLNDEQKLKMYIKMQNPLYDQELVDDDFKTNYGVDENKFKDADGNLVDPMGLRKAKVRAEQQRMNDVQKANDYFSQFKSKIDLPKIEPPVDEKYVSFQNFANQADQQYEKLVAASKMVKPEDIPLNIKFADEASKLNVDVNIQMDKEGFDRALNTVLSYVIVDESYLNQDGSPRVGDMVRDVYFAQNREKTFNEIIVQAVNAERKRAIAAQKNYSEGGRGFAPHEQSETEKLKQQVFGK